MRQKIHICSRQGDFICSRYENYLVLAWFDVMITPISFWDYTDYAMIPLISNMITPIVKDDSTDLMRGLLRFHYIFAAFNKRT